MKTQKEILQKIKDVSADDCMGIQRQDLISSLNFENAKPYLNENTTEKEWNKNVSDTDEKVKAVMIDYISFAYDKVLSQRGLSAERSMDHYTSWLWLIGADLGDITNYSDYGIENLNKISDFLGLDASSYK